MTQTNRPFSGNHTGYRQVKGTKTSAEDIRNLYEGLTQSHLTDFDVLLSGYAPSAAAVEAVGDIAQDLKRRAEAKPGSFFWRKFISVERLSLFLSLIDDNDSQFSTPSWVI